jgi:hypothetical protein
MAKRIKRKNRTISFYKPNGEYLGKYYLTSNPHFTWKQWVKAKDGGYVIIREKNGKETIHGKHKMKKKR